MSLNFDTGVEEQITIADIAAVRFEGLETWTLLAFFRVENTDGDDRCIFAKWPAMGQHFLLRTDLQGAPANIEVYTNGALSITGGDSVALNTWYCIAVTNDGTENAGGFKYYLIGMDGSIVNTVSDQHDSDAVDLTGELSIGGRASNDEMDGDIDYVCYIQQELTQAQCVAYSQNPYRLAQSLQTAAGNVVFFLKLGMGGINAVDLSGQATSWTVPGTLVVSNPPPVAPLFGFDVGLPYEVAAVGGALKDLIGGFGIIPFPR